MKKIKNTDVAVTDVVTSLLVPVSLVTCLPKMRRLTNRRKREEGS